MNRLLTFAALLTVLVLPPSAGGTGAVGCAALNSPTSAIAIAQGVAQTAATVVADAQAVWPVIYAGLPAAQQATAQTDFNEAIFTANHAILTLDDGIAAAIAAGTTDPNFTSIFSSLADAVGQVVAIIQNFQSATPAAAVRSTRTGVNALGDMQAALLRLKAAK